MLELFVSDGLNVKVTGIIKGNVVFPVTQLVCEIKGGAFRNGNADAARGFLDAAARLTQTEGTAIIAYADS